MAKFNKYVFVQRINKLALKFEYLVENCRFAYKLWVYFRISYQTKLTFQRNFMFNMNVSNQKKFINVFYYYYCFFRCKRHTMNNLSRERISTNQNIQTLYSRHFNTNVFKAVSCMLSKLYWFIFIIEFF